MKGQIAIPEIEIKYNRMGWNAFDLFKHCLAGFTKKTTAGWYAYILKDSIYYFLWCDSKSIPNEKYLNALKADGYNLGISVNVSSIAFYSNLFNNE